MTPGGGSKVPGVAEKDLRQSLSPTVPNTFRFRFPFSKTKSIRDRGDKGLAEGYGDALVNIPTAPGPHRPNITLGPWPRSPHTVTDSAATILIGFVCVVTRRDYLGGNRAWRRCPRPRRSRRDGRVRRWLTAHTTFHSSFLHYFSPSQSRGFCSLFVIKNIMSSRGPYAPKLLTL